jgi:4-azaleucine resistance transporter AzlC
MTLVSSTMPTQKQEFLAGMKATIPMIIGAMPFGVILGAVAVTGDSSLSPTATIGMSLFVFAGSAQFIAAGLVSEGIGVGLIIFTTFIVNLRHALYSASLAPYTKHLPQRWLLPLAFWLTDESYAVAISRYNQSDESPYKHWFYLGSTILMYCNWQLCTILGVIAGKAIPDATSWGLDFAMVVTFIGIVVPLVVNRPMVVSVVVAASTAILFDPLPNKMGLMIASLLGIVAGYLAETHMTRINLRQEPETRKETPDSQPLQEQVS